MKLTPSILPLRGGAPDFKEPSLAREASLFSEASWDSGSSEACTPRNRAPLVGASEKGSVTPSEKGSVTPRASSTALTPAEKAETQRERTAFLERYNPQVCRHMALDADRCFCGCAPALEVVRRRYGTQTAVAWVTIQLSETARLWGSSDKIPGEMLEAVAESFVGEYSKLNLAEIGLYLSRLRAGVYGKVAYGKLTPDHLVSNLPTFLAQRSKEIEVYRRNAEREERNRERQRWAARAVSHEVATQMYEEALKHCNNDPQQAIEYLKKSRS